MMVARLGDARVEACRGLAHREDYRCPGCGLPVVLHARVGGWVIPHFKHKAKSECPNGTGETAAHRAVKALLRDHFRDKGLRVEVEKRTAGRRADVYLPDSKTAYEAEFSNKETHEFIGKCHDYARHGVKSLWIFHQRQIKTESISEDAKILVTTSPILRLIDSRHCPKDARAAFFAYDDNEAVIFRGALETCILYTSENEYTGEGGSPYASRRWKRLLITDVIREEPPAPHFSAEAARAKE